jgi:hypothetical protein
VVFQLQLIISKGAPNAQGDESPLLCVPWLLVCGGGRLVGAAGSFCRGRLATAGVGCKSEVAMTRNKMSFVNIFTTNMGLSESDRHGL